ncbi:MAG TPA: hypothetical protein PLJ27_09315 [Polyangiaceae bacterium]|nr:hypothetical protein [Polyangiaceae bacterium]
MNERISAYGRSYNEQIGADLHLRLPSNTEPIHRRDCLFEHRRFLNALIANSDNHENHRGAGVTPMTPQEHPPPAE